MTCAVCGHILAGVAVDEHVHAEHPEVAEAYERWAVQRRAALGCPGLSAYLRLLRMQRLRVRPIDADYKPVGQQVVLRFDVTTGWGWCPLCRTASQPFDFIGHYPRHHSNLIEPQVDGFDVEILAAPFLGET